MGAANDLALQTEAVIVISGPTDYITDGTYTASVALGSPQMALTTGTGCVASAIIAAHLTSKLLNHTATLNSKLYTLNSTIKAMTLMGQAGTDMSHFLERLHAYQI